MKRKGTQGFTIVELSVAILIVMLAMGIALQALVSMNKDYRILVAYVVSLIKGREIIDRISKDCRMAVRVMDNYATYTTTDSSFILKVPSVDSPGNIIDVNNEFDYIIYRLEGADLWKIVIPGSKSARSAQSSVFKKGINQFHLAFGGQPLSGIPHKSAITHITMWMGISDFVMGKEYKITPGTTVKLMNYEWEFVR